MKWYVFPSDMFLLTAFAGMCVLVFTQRKKDWFIDFKSRLSGRWPGRVALLILSLYMLIGLLDSMHFKLYNEKGQTTGNIVSCLDLVLVKIYPGVTLEENGVMNTQLEEGYSKPLASVLYNPSMISYGGADSADTRMHDPLHKPGIHLFGTDKSGGDIFYKLLKGVRTGIVVGMVTPLFSFPLALILGCMAGYFGSFLDDLIQSIYTLISSIPGILLIIALVMILDIKFQVTSVRDIMIKDDLRVLGLCAILGLLGWTGLCRLIRAEVYKLKTLPFIESARMMNVPWYLIFWRHLFPNLVPLLIISFVLSFSSLVMVESVLQFLQVGVPSSVYSWGRVLDGVRDELGRVPFIWWPLGSVFLIMFGLVFPLNYIGDVLRDTFDVKLRDEQS